MTGIPFSSGEDLGHPQRNVVEVMEVVLPVALRPRARAQLAR